MTAKKLAYLDETDHVDPALLPGGAFPAPSALGYTGYGPAQFGVEHNGTESSGGGIIWDTVYPLTVGGAGSSTTDDVDNGYMTAAPSVVGMPTIHQAGWYKVNVEVDFSVLDVAAEVAVNVGDTSGLQKRRTIAAGFRYLQEEFICYLPAGATGHVTVAFGSGSTASFNYAALTFVPLFADFDPLA